MSTEMDVDNADLDIDVEQINQIDTSGLDPLLRAIVEKAAAKGRKKAEKLAAKIASDRKGKVLGWKERQAKRRADEREVRIKGGAEIMETAPTLLAWPS